MPTITISNDQHDSLVLLLSELLDAADREDFESRRDYLGYVTDLSDLFTTLRSAD